MPVSALSLRLRGLARQFIKEELKIRCYVRYVDDMMLVHRDGDYLRECLRRIRGFAGHELKLRLNRKTQLFPVKNGVDFLGFHSYLTGTGRVIREVRHASAKRMKRKARVFVEKYRRGEISLAEIERSLYSWLGHAEQGDTYGLRCAILENLILTKEGA